LVRRLDKFFTFIDVAAQLNGEVVNFKKMARRIAVSDKTIRSHLKST
jgi:hypothetical protein